MNNGTTIDSRRHQFGLSSLFEFVTVCGLLSALAPLIGAGAMVGLILMALSLWVRRGELALLFLVAACLAADRPGDVSPEVGAVFRQLLVILTAAGLSNWYRLRRCHPGDQHAPPASRPTPEASGQTCHVSCRCAGPN
jgi:hypothetical protein